jgi:hypothetical protein
LPENLIAFLPWQFPLVHLAGASPPKFLHGFVGEFVVDGSLACGSNDEIKQLRKNEEAFRFESRESFCLHRHVGRPRVVVPSAPFFYLFYSAIRVVVCPPTPRA